MAQGDGKLEGGVIKYAGANTPGWISNIGLAAATTTNANDSIKITSADGSALSAQNPGHVTIASTTTGLLTTFVVTADVTIDLTGAHWDLGANGDYTDIPLGVYALNNNGSLVWGVARQLNRNVFLNTEDSATATDINLVDEILVNSVLSADAQALQVGYFLADFDDTGGAAEDLWSVQTADGEIMVGVPIYNGPSYLHLQQSNGHGSTNTKIRRFTNTITYNTPDIAYVDSAANGATMTAKRNGIYVMSITDHFSAASIFGISINSSQLTTDINSLGQPAERICMGRVQGANENDTACTVSYLSKGDIVRVHTQGVTDGSIPDTTIFLMARVN